MSERIISSYQPLVQVHILHHYWLDDGNALFDTLPEDAAERAALKLPRLTPTRVQHLRNYDVRQFLAITPTPTTAKSLLGLGCIFKNTALGFVVIAPRESGLSKACEVRRISVSNDNEQQKKIQEFQSEFESNKKECAVLIVNSTNVPDKWTIAGFDDKGVFKSILIDDPNSELALELKKEPENERKIAKLVTSRLGRSLSKEMQFEFVLTVKNPDFFNYTALTLQPQPISELYVEAEDKTYRYKKNVPVLSNLTGYRRTDGLDKSLYLSKAIPAYSDSADYSAEALVQKGDALMQLTGDQSGPGAKPQEIKGPVNKIMPIFVHQGDVPAEGILLGDIPDDVFALIRLATVRADDDEFSLITGEGTAKTPAPIFQIRFKNRSTQWLYYHANTGKNVPPFFVEPDPLPLTFFGNASPSQIKKSKPSQGLVIPEIDENVPPKVLGLRSEIFE